MKFTVEMTTRGVDIRRYEEVYFSEAFNRAVMKAVNLKQRSVQERRTQPDGKQYTRIRIVPNLALPAMITKRLEGHEISYDEITVFDAAPHTATFAIESLARDTVQVTGVARFIEEPNAVRFHFDGDARVRVFAIGGLIERFIISEVKKRYALVEAALQRFISEG